MWLVRRCRWRLFNGFSAKIVDHRDGEAPAEPFGRRFFRGFTARREPRPPDAAAFLHKIGAEPLNVIHVPTRSERHQLPSRRHKESTLSPTQIPAGARNCAVPRGAIFLEVNPFAFSIVELVDRWTLCLPEFTREVPRHVQIARIKISVRCHCGNPLFVRQILFEISPKLTPSQQPFTDAEQHDNEHDEPGA